MGKLLDRAEASAAPRSKSPAKGVAKPIGAAGWITAVLGGALLVAGIGKAIGGNDDPVVIGFLVSIGSSGIVSGLLLLGAAEALDRLAEIAERLKK